MTVSRSTSAGAAYLDLRKRAKIDKRPFEELLALHVLDGFLARLSVSPQKDRMVLKGGVLLAAFDLRRPTRDVDLMAQDLSNDAENVLGVVRGIAKLAFADGVVFDCDDAEAKVIRDDDEYSGVRVSMTAHVATANVTFHVDVNVGDPISPAPQDITLPRVLGDAIALRGYPMAMVHAEKILTAISRGTANTRWRDFGDIYSLVGRHAINGDDLTTSLRSVAEHRRVVLAPLATVLDGYAAIAQSRYSAWLRKQGREDLPGKFQDTLDRVFTFSDPALTGNVSQRTWSPVELAWE